VHIPEPRRHLVRYYGWYSNVSRVKRRKPEGSGAGHSLEGSARSRNRKRDDGPGSRALRKSWAQLIKRIYEVDPLQCPSCGGEMKVVAFITEHEVVDRILRHLKRTEERRQRAPPG